MVPLIGQPSLLGASAMGVEEGLISMLIDGTLHVEGLEPDGDSVKLLANDQDLWRALKDDPDFNVARGVNLNKHLMAQLRLKWGDTLETHFLGKHQPAYFAHGATDTLLQLLQIKHIVWSKGHKRVISAHDNVPALALVVGVDVYGRPIAALIPGVPNLPAKPGEKMRITPDILRQTVNFKMVEQGLAYPTFYEDMGPELRGAMFMVAQQAREKGLGLWAVDATMEGAKVYSLSSVTDHFVILPKLFRRLVAFYSEYKRRTGHEKMGLGGFDRYLATHPDPIFIMGPGQHASPAHEGRDAVLADVIDIDTRRNVVKLKIAPEYLVFKEKKAA